MRGYNFFFVPLAIIGFILIIMLANTIMFTQTERNIVYTLGFLMVGIFLVLSMR